MADQNNLARNQYTNSSWREALSSDDDSALARKLYSALNEAMDETNTELDMLFTEDGLQAWTTFATRLRGSVRLTSWGEA